MSIGISADENAVPLKATEYSAVVCDECHKDDTATIEPKAAICLCGGQILKVKTTYGLWYAGSERGCIHYPYGTDLQRYRTVTDHYRCNNCSKGTTRTTTEYKWECHGYR